MRYDDAFQAHQIARWLKPDAGRWVRADAARFLLPDADLADAFPALDRKYSPSQRRIPAGRPGGGRWTNGEEGLVGRFLNIGQQEEIGTSEGADDLEPGTSAEDAFAGWEAGDAREREGIDDPRVISDADPEEVVSGEQYAQSRQRGGAGRVQINGEAFDLTPAQGARLSAAQANAESAVARIREIEPDWKPPQSAYQTPEGLIRAYQAESVAAQARASELATKGLLAGPFAGESLPARGPKRDFSMSERREINRIGSETGCHTCGTRDPETVSGNFVIDHQIPSALNFGIRAQRLFPHCLTCSLTQGGWVSSLKGRR